MDIEIVEEENPLKPYLAAQREVFNLIPKNKQELLYIGLTSKLNRAIDEYIRVQSANVINNLKNEFERQILLKDERILELERLCDNAGIKHKLTSEDVYSSSGRYKGD